jgi:hypothetical protein
MSTNTFPAVVITHNDEKIHRRILAEASNRHNMGKFNVVLEVTLRASQTTTTIQDNRITANSVFVFMPTTAHAATAAANIYVSESTITAATNTTPGSAVITHASSANTDQSFRVGILG